MFVFKKNIIYLSKVQISLSGQSPSPQKLINSAQLKYPIK